MHGALQCKNLPIIFQLDSSHLFGLCSLCSVLYQSKYIKCWRNWYGVWGHGCDTTDWLLNVTTIEAQPRLWWHFGVCGVNEAMTENEVSISILSWYRKIKFKLGVTQLSKFKEQSHFKHWVSRPDCFATHNNHCDVKAGLVSLNDIDTLDKRCHKICNDSKWITRRRYWKYIAKIYPEKYTYSSIGYIC